MSTYGNQLFGFQRSTTVIGTITEWVSICTGRAAAYRRDLVLDCIWHTRSNKSNMFVVVEELPTLVFIWYLLTSYFEWVAGTVPQWRALIHPHASWWQCQVGPQLQLWVMLMSAATLKENEETIVWLTTSHLIPLMTRKWSCRLGDTPVQCYIFTILLIKVCYSSVEPRYGEVLHQILSQVWKKAPLEQQTETVTILQSTSSR